MNYTYCIITTLSFFALQQCFAMEKKSNKTPANIIHTIKTIKKPRSVVCFQGDIIAIEGHEECSIYKVTEKQEIRRIKNNDTIKCIAGHPTKPLLAIISEKNLQQGYLRIYNALTGDRIAELQQNDLQSPLVFNQINDTLIVRYLWNTLCIHDCKTLAEMASYKMHQGAPLIAFSPTANECAFYSSKRITIFNTKESFTATDKGISTIPHAATALLYSSDGSFILCNTYNNTYYIVDFLSNPKAYEGDFNTIAMNPTSFILAGFSINNKCIDYINTQKQGSIIASTNLSTFNIDRFLYGQYIQFFSDGKRVIIMGSTKCYELQVPFDALYQPGTKEKCINSLWTLRNCIDNNNEPLLQDIRHLLVKYLLAVSQYSLTNH